MLRSTPVLALPFKPALPPLQITASAPDVPALAHMWLTAPDMVYEGETFLVEIALADWEVQVENGRGSARIRGASTGNKDLCILPAAARGATARI